MQGSASPKDVARGVDIGVILVTARATGKDRLVHTVTRVDVPAFKARLARMTRVNQ